MSERSGASCEERAQRSEPGGVQGAPPIKPMSDRNGAKASEGRQAGCRGPRRYINERPERSESE